VAPEPAGATPLLEIEDVRKSYGDLLVLDGITLGVPAGQALGIVGPNGAGKSTLLSIVNGTETPSGGRIRIDGHDVTRRDSAARCALGVGRSFQIPRPFADLTVYENVLVGATRDRRAGPAATRRAALAALEVAGMIDQANVRAGSLPLLGRKRLEMARALATSPRLLLLDEIAGGLTEAEADDLVGEIQGLKASGITLIWIEHVVAALVQVVDRLICLASGSVLKDGEPGEVLRSPEVVEVYLGSAA
jgi:branched-chain amino acid transport system ATP-binding protein